MAKRSLKADNPASNDNLPALVPYRPDAIKDTVAEILMGDRVVVLPNDPEVPAGLQDHNVLAFAILKKALFDLTPRQIGFLGQMTRHNSLSIKQRKWLVDLAATHLGIDVAVAS